ncbi:MAG: class I SAM-dependent methyltransferase [Chloroflexi bacterium]|nr:class I SAM-dependent methyltransferase [Chloroflexota bacterium]
MINKTSRKPIGPRLAYFSEHGPDYEHWDAVWQKALSPAFYDSAKRGRLDEFEAPFTKHLSRTEKILEAGCGLGQLVLALHVRGYNVEGVDWASETIQRVKELFPDLKIRQGDVSSLEVPDETYQGYISIGVMEHIEEGPDVFLKEAFRVLKPGGVALITVPHYYWLRRLKARLGLYRIRPGAGAFYQYAYHPKEFISIAERYRFRNIEAIPYSGYKGFKDELPFVPLALRFLKPLGKYGGRIQRNLERFLSLPFFEWAFGHMILLVFQKT